MGLLEKTCFLILGVSKLVQGHISFVQVVQQADTLAAVNISKPVNTYPPGYRARSHDEWDKYKGKIKEALASHKLLEEAVLQHPDWPLREKSCHLPPTELAYWPDHLNTTFSGYKLWHCEYDWCFNCLLLSFSCRFESL